MKTILFSSLTTLLAALSLSATANAADVTWQKPFAVTDGITGNVSTDGTFERAYNFAGATTTVNGVIFTAAVTAWGPDRDKCLGLQLDSGSCWRNRFKARIKRADSESKVSVSILGDVPQIVKIRWGWLG